MGWESRGGLSPAAPASSRQQKPPQQQRPEGSWVEVEEMPESNASCPDCRFHREARHSLAAVLIFTIVVDILGNVLVILSVLRNRKLRNAAFAFAWPHLVEFKHPEA